MSLFFQYSFSQNTGSLKGSVYASSSGEKLTNATVCVLTASDSIIYSFTRVNNVGNFLIEGLVKGKYIIQVNYPGYIIYSDYFKLDSSITDVDVGRINLTLQSSFLNEVIITGTQTAIKIKGDTTEYNASSFKIQPNATIEDLLKQLPGMRVDKNGKITAKGQTINKVLVEGEEFFGDDPTLVTKNLRADMVDKVQLYDKKSDQSTLTGIDDGRGKAVLNIKLKEDKKTGYFGKVIGGLATNNFYEGQAMFNLFTKKLKIAAYSTLSNTGKIGLGWEDNSMYGGSELGFSETGLISISGSKDELDTFDGRYNGVGIPNGKTGGVHFSNKWNNDRETINTNYKIGTLNVRGSKNLLTSNNQVFGSINSNEDLVFDNTLFRQKINTTYQLKIDTSANLKITFDGAVREGETKSNFENITYNNDKLLNNSVRNFSNSDNGSTINAVVLWTKKFRKKGRTLSLKINGFYNENDVEGNLFSSINYIDEQLNAIENLVVDQYKTSNIRTLAIGTNVSYSEPLTKSISAVFSYNFLSNNTQSDRKSFDKSADGAYDFLDKKLSSNYELRQILNEGGAIFNFKKDKIMINLGTKLGAVNFIQKDTYSSLNYTRDFINWNPIANIQYKLSSEKTIKINYLGNNIQPTLEQLQPIIVNNDPLNITIGNAFLRPAFNNWFKLDFQSYRKKTTQFVGVILSYNTISSPIAFNISTDAQGKSVYQAINIKDQSANNFRVNIALGRKLKGPDIDLGLNMSSSAFTSYNLINGLLNKSWSNIYSTQFSLAKQVQKKFDINLTLTPNYSFERATFLRSNNDGAGLNTNLYFNIYIPGNVKIYADVDYLFRAKTQLFNEDFKRLTINSNIAKSFLKDKSLQLTLSVNDLLNQNTGFNRDINANGLMKQTTFTNIKRYFMTSLIWNFSQMGSTQKKIE